VININKLLLGKMTKKEELSVHIARRQQLHITDANPKYFGLSGIGDNVPVSNLWNYPKIITYII